MRPTTTSPSRIPIVAGTAPPSRTARSERRPTSTPSPGGNPCATSVVSSATTPRPSADAARTSSARRITASLRAARSSVRRLRARGAVPPTSQPAASASPAPVVSTALDGHAPESSRPRRRRRRGPRFTTHVASTLAECVALALVREHDIGRERTHARAERVVDERERREVDGDPCAGGARELRGPLGRGRDRLARQRVAGDVERIAVETTTGSSSSGRSSGAAPRSDAIVRSPAGGDRRRRRRSAAGGPVDVDAAAAKLARDDLPCRVAAALRRRTAPLRRAPPPTPRRSPPARRRRRASRRRCRRPRRAAGRGSTITSRMQVAERRQPHRTMLSWTATVAAAGLGRSRSAGSSAPPARSPPRVGSPAVAPPADAPAGLAAFEDAPCFLEVVEREAQRYREGGGEIDDRPVERRVAVRS